MSSTTTRIAAVVHKELNEFRRNRLILFTMAVLPVFFLVSPTTTILASKAAAGSQKLDNQVGLGLMFLMLIPVLIPRPRSLDRERLITGTKPSTAH
ncbi:hypothetical protein P3T36_004223 [Kitasatospora sp. MAP12-15]|uniref:hypothetical protein n=1 Tax=unclassified Kitasatospora TaxID=2633591 RepID=UPI00247613B0|nr:hypothetical protein [Kitasatospora sp. MAP12-44]MDH6108312.1 hypothetical protein [Kitasatospora sp. MAP12-44]